MPARQAFVTLTTAEAELVAGLDAFSQQRHLRVRANYLREQYAIGEIIPV